MFEIRTFIVALHNYLLYIKSECKLIDLIVVIFKIYIYRLLVFTL